MQFLIVCKYCVKPFVPRFSVRQIGKKNDVIKCGNRDKMVANSIVRAPNPQLHQRSPWLNPPTTNLLCSVQKSQKDLKKNKFSCSS